MRRSQGISLVLCHLVLALVASATYANSEPPNIIFFLVDDYDKPETSVYGGNVLTPNLDRMAREGMTLTNAHMTSTVCTPSRYTCLTGRYAGASTCEYYLRENPLGQQGAPAFNVELEPDNMNVGQVLKDNGYATGYVGKYHVGPHIDEENATRFDWCYIPKNTEYSADVQRMKQHNQQRVKLPAWNPVVLVAVFVGPDIGRFSMVVEFDPDICGTSVDQLGICPGAEVEIVRIAKLGPNVPFRIHATVDLASARISSRVSSAFFVLTLGK